MNKHTETPRPMPGRGPKPLTAEELLALPEYVLKRFEDLTRTDDPTEVKEVFEDFIAFAPDLARVATDLTAQLDAERFAHANTAAKVKRVEALAETWEEATRLVEARGGDAETVRDILQDIRAALNGGNA